MTHESLLSYSLRSRILAGRRGKIEAKVTDIPFLFADIAEVNIFSLRSFCISSHGSSLRGIRWHFSHV